MHRYILALVMGFLSRPAAPGAPAVTGAALAPAVAVARAPQLPSSALVSRDEAAAARKEIVHTRTQAEDGKVVHRFAFPGGGTVEFADRPKAARDAARRDRVVQYFGTESAAAEPAATFEAAGRAAGLSPAAVEALRFVSRHEGGFDAINTWDRARFSWGFIQFAGGYGFPPVLAQFKSRNPALFQQLLGRYGIDVQAAAGGRPEPVYVDADSGRVLRGADAEQAYGDDPLTIALFVRAGRVPEVKQYQVETAIRDYAAPALLDSLDGVRLSDVLRSPQSLAMLIDRKVHEGNVERLEWALEHARITANLANPADWSRLEGQVLDLAIQDADARNNVVSLAGTAADALARAGDAAAAGMAQLVPEGPTLTAARAALEQALAEADYRMVVGYRRDAVRTGVAAALAATDPARCRLLTADSLRDELRQAAAGVRELVSRFRYEANIRDRLKDIRTSSLPGPS